MKIRAEGKNLKGFIERISKGPPLAVIDKIEIKRTPFKGFRDFRIIKSNTSESRNTEIMPDIATCTDCISDIFNSENRRFRYPFTTCTQCGPRFSIIETLPYDRIRTTMKGFRMCKECEREYNSPEDRRFHSQPNACSECGPHLLLLDKRGRIIETNDPIKTVSQLLLKGHILAIKGIGGFHIACDATNTQTVLKLRKRKNRPKKPFALMIGSIEEIKRICKMNEEEERIIKSPEAPILLLKKKGNGVSREISPNNRYLGVMLPYSPLHHLLFKENLPPLVMTSANPKDEPLIADRRGIVERLGKVVDFILDHNRKIENPCDDSILFLSKGRISVRRARGFVPKPIRLPFKLPSILGCGPRLKNTFALAKDEKVYLSTHIGDLNTLSTLSFFEKNLERYKKWFSIEPEIVVCDLHPDYLSTRYAEFLKKPLIRVQHHYAHIASVMAENGLKGRVIGLSFDGTGYGTDGKIWGGEFLIADYKGFERVEHLSELPLIGGDAAIYEPARTAASYILYLFGEETLNSIGLGDYSWLKSQLRLRINLTPTTSMGRLFDAVAALIGLKRKVSFDGEAPIALEAIAKRGEKGDYGENLDPANIFEGIIRDLKTKTPKPLISARFHNTIIRGSLKIVKRLYRETKLSQVCLSGGVFQNRIILEGIIEGIEGLGLKVYTNRETPINDGGVSLGQVVVGGFKYS